MYTLAPLSAEYFPSLLAVWEASVRASHSFLSEQDIVDLRPQVLEAFGMVRLYAAWQGTEPVAFIGLGAEQEPEPVQNAAPALNKIEMLFVHPAHFRQGLGRRLVGHAATLHPVRLVDVNEQNPRALAFYQHLGFRVVGRSALDGQGRPFPLVHLALRQACKGLPGLWQSADAHASL